MAFPVVIFDWEKGTGTPQSSPSAAVPEQQPPLLAMPVINVD